MMKKIFYIVLLFCMNPLFAQNENDVLVKIGDKSISVGEFKYRYELTPQIDRKYNDKGKAKEELLYTLIAEKLFALEGEKYGYDTLKAMKMNYIPLEKMHVRDALYQNEIASKVELDVNKFSDGLKLANHKCFVEYIYSKDKKNIDDAYTQLLTAANFDSIAATFKNVEYVKEPYEVSYGKMYYKVEEKIFKLRINEFTEPVESPDGWYIFRLISKIPVTYKGNDQRTSMVKKVVEGRIEDSIFNDYWNGFFVNQSVSTDGPLFWYFVNETQKVVSKIKTEQNIADNEKISVTNNHFIELKNGFHPDSLKKVFIKFDKDPLTFNDFLNDFSFEGFYTFTTDLNTIAAQLNSRVKRQIELELLARDGYERGMESLPEVKSSTEIWRNNYLSTLYMKDIVLNTELNDNDIQSYLGKNNGKSFDETKVNIIEVLTDSLEVIKEALSISDNDSLFRSFAKEHTKREWTREKNGEFGYFSTIEHGEIGNIAGSMNIGDVYGPLETDEGYSLFKVIDKKVEKVSTDEGAVSEDVKRKIKYTKIKDHLENLAAELADKYNVTVNDELLNSLNLLNAQMVVFRYMGFGGRIQAFPYSSPFFQWKEKWEQKKKDLL